MNVILQSLCGISNTVSRIERSDNEHELRKCQKGSYLEREEKSTNLKKIAIRMIIVQKMMKMKQKVQINNNNNNKNRRSDGLDRKKNKNNRSSKIKHNSSNKSSKINSNTININAKAKRKKKDIKTYELAEIVVYVGRKLCTDDNMQDEIQIAHFEHISKLAAIRSYDVFV